MSDSVKRAFLKLKREFETLREQFGNLSVSDGADGPRGPKGDAGRDGTNGADGPRGPKGETGRQGRDGRDGQQGATGAGVTRVEVEAGNQLAVWVGEAKIPAGAIEVKDGKSITGPKGDKGDKGSAGPKGDKGDKGSAGPKGDSVTDVKLEGNDLFVWINNIKRKAGRLTVPTLSQGSGGVRTAPVSAAKMGFFDYNDLATQTTPVNVPGGLVNTDIPNDGLGPFTSKAYAPAGVTNVWDAQAGRFDWGQLRLGDTLDIRLDLLVTTTSPNQEVEVDLLLGEGAGEYAIPFMAMVVKATGEHKFVQYNGVYMGDENTLGNPAHFQIRSDDPLTLVVNGWYCRIIRQR